MHTPHLRLKLALALLAAGPAICLLAPSSASAATYYVRISGNDGDDGDESEDAFRTIAHAVSVVSSGDTVYIGAGTYTQDITINNITGSSATRFIADTTGTHTGDAGDVIFASENNITISNSQRIELHNFTFTGDSTESVRWTSTTDGLVKDCVVNGGNDGIQVDSGTVTIDGAQIQNCSDDAIDINGGEITILNTTASLSAYGVDAQNAVRVSVTDSTFSQNSIGIYSSLNVTLEVTNCTVNNNTTWGIAHYASSASTATATITGGEIHSNTAGVSIADAEDGDFSITGSAIIRDNTQSGLHFTNCTLTLNSQALGTNWTTLRNGCGISCDNSTLTLTNIAVDQSSSYSLHADNSTVTVAACAFSGQQGIFATSSNAALTVSTSRLDATATGGWGITRYGGNVDVTNCVISGFDSGIYLSTSSGSDTAAVTNSTLGNLSAYGVFLQSGDATLTNTIVAGTSGVTALMDVPGQLTHSHNLLHGFTTIYSNTSADATELIKNPRFVDAANGDLHLGKASPAINGGTAAVGVAADFDGNSRPIFNAHDIGAYEYTSADGSYRILKWNED